MRTADPPSSHRPSRLSRPSITRPGLALVLAALAAAPAFTATAAPNGNAAALAEARSHFASARKAFDAGDYERAIAEFRAADAAKPSALLEYNIAAAMERLGRNDEAALALERYLERDPRSPRRAEVTRRISELRGRPLGAQEVQERSTGPTVPPPQADTLPPAGDPPSAQPPPTAQPAPLPLPPWLEDPPPSPIAPAPPSTTAAPPVRRFALGLRLGMAGPGKLGENDANMPVPKGAGAVLEPFFRFALTGSRLQGEVALALRSHAVGDQAGKIDITTLRARIGWFSAVWRPWLELGASAGIDWNAVKFATAPSVSGTVWGLWAELTARFLLGSRHELLVTPLGAQVVPGLDVGASQQGTAHILGADRGSLSLQFLLGYALRL